MQRPNSYYSSYSEDDTCQKQHSQDELSSDNESSQSNKEVDVRDDSLEENSIESGTSADEQEAMARPSFGQYRSSGSAMSDASSANIGNDELSNKGTKRKAPTSSLMENSKIRKMMSIMDYKEGEGLGKHGQGRQVPIEASQQKGRRGLGFEYKELQEANYKYNPDDEIVQVVEKMDWLENKNSEHLSSFQLENWMTLGPAKMTIDDETEFCDERIVKDVVSSKSVFDKLDRNEMREARTRSNPFETIRANIFLNRAAVKMANMDRACDMMFTNPKLEPDELLYFADVCAGPGGFSEYVLWRKKWRAKGFGFTLKRSCDFKMQDFLAGPSETFHPYYGPSEDVNKQGDVFLPENQEALYELVMQHTDGRGVHFMMADGGFSVQGQENIQEILSKQLYLCQCLVALMIVRQGGHFVTKLFDLFTPFSAGLVYLMHRCFDSVSIFKPNTSRPANSERYLICRGKRSHTNDVVDYLKEINLQLLRREKSKDVVEIVPRQVLRQDEAFFDYLKISNQEIGRNQITGLLKIAAYAENKSLIESRQKEMLTQCLEHWGLPNTSRTGPKRMGPDEMIRKLEMTNLIANCALEIKDRLGPDNVASIFTRNSIFNWFFVPCEYGKESPKMPTFYLGTGGTKIYEYRSGGCWAQLKNEYIRLPAQTLIYGELVQEFEKEHKRQRHFSVLHVIDALVLGGEDISNRDLCSRHRLIKQFCKALYKVERNATVQIRAKDLLPLDRCRNLTLMKRHMKSGQPVRLGYDLPKTSLDENNKSKDEPCFFLPKSIIFLKYTKNGWNRCFSKTNNNAVYFSKFSPKDPKGISFFENSTTTVDHIAGFADSFESRVLWLYPNNETYLPIQFSQYLQDILPPPHAIAN